MIQTKRTRRQFAGAGFALGTALAGGTPVDGAARDGSPIATCAVRHRTIRVGQAEIFFREAGSPSSPAMLLLHGFANSSHYFRHLMPLLAKQYYLVAPDLPFFGFSAVDDEPQRKVDFRYLSTTMSAFVEALELHRFSMYVFDYGAPVGFDLALRYPDRVTAIVSQNGNAYEEGLNDPAWQSLRAYWAAPSSAVRPQLRDRMTFAGVRQAYFHGVSDPSRIEPEAYWLDASLLARPGMIERQVDLKLDYDSNISKYPLYQQYLRSRRPPFLAIWGKHDWFFTPAGAEAFRRDVPDADIRLLDTGHFALETHVDDIANAIASMRI